MLEKSYKPNKVDKILSQLLPVNSGAIQTATDNTKSQEVALRDSSQSVPKRIKNETDVTGKIRYSISIYGGEPLAINKESMNVFSEVINKLLLAFPSMSETGEEFFPLLIERVVANGFTKERLIDAVLNVIDNYNYPTLRISAITSFDKRKRVYTYNEVADIVCHESGVRQDTHFRVIPETTTQKGGVRLWERIK